MQKPVADSGLPRRWGGRVGAEVVNPKVMGDTILSFGQIAPENCIKAKEIGPKDRWTL